jgi:hypothetical protein
VGARKEHSEKSGRDGLSSDSEAVTGATLMIDLCEFDGLFDGSLLRLYASQLTPSQEMFGTMVTVAVRTRRV